MCNQDLGTDNIALSDYLGDYLKTKHGLQSVVVRWGYVIYYGLIRHSAECPEVKLFLTVVQARMPVQVYDEKQKLFIELKSLLKRIGNLEQVEGGKKILKDDLFATLPRFFPDKTDVRMSKLKAIIDEMQPMSLVDTTKLFRKGEGNCHSSLQEEITRQYLEEYEEVMCSLETETMQSSGGKVTKIYQIFKKRCLWLSPLKLHSYLAVGIDIPLEEVDERLEGTPESLATWVVDEPTFLRNLRKGVFVELMSYYDPKAEPLIVHGNTQKIFEQKSQAIMRWNVLKIIRTMT
jgi:hypothetical protein